MESRQTSPPDPPGHLSDRAKALWRVVVPRRCRTSERLALVRLALELLDRADAARAIVAQEGMIAKNLGSGTKHVHPAQRILETAERQFIGLWAKLGLDASPQDRNPCFAGFLATDEQPAALEQIAAEQQAGRESLLAEQEAAGGPPLDGSPNGDAED